MSAKEQKSNIPRTRSIEDSENYATYLALPLIELNKANFGSDNFIIQ